MTITQWSKNVDTTYQKINDQKHLYGSSVSSKLFSKGTKNLEGKEYWGKVFENFTNAVHLKFSRIAHLLNVFSGGEWVNNKRAYGELKERVEELNQLSAEVLSPKDRDEVQEKIGQMRAACEVLRKAKGLKKGQGKNILPIEQMLAQVEEKLKASPGSSGRKKGSKDSTTKKASVVSAEKAGKSTKPPERQDRVSNVSKGSTKVKKSSDKSSDKGSSTSSKLDKGEASREVSKVKEKSKSSSASKASSSKEDLIEPKLQAEQEKILSEKDYQRMVDEQKDQLRIHLEYCIDKFLMDPKVAVSDDESLQLAHLIKGNVRDLSRKEIKDHFKTATAIFTSPKVYQEKATYMKNFNSLTKSLLKKLKDLELEKARYKAKKNIPLDESERKIFEKKVAQNLERFERDAQPTQISGVKDDFERGARSTGASTLTDDIGKKASKKKKSKVDTDAQEMDIYTNVTDPRLVAVNIRKDLKYLLKHLESDPRFIDKMKGFMGDDPYERLTALSNFSYDVMTAEECADSVREALILFKDNYSSLESSVEIRMERLSSLVDYWDSVKRK